MPTNYIQVTIQNVSAEQSDLLVAKLAELGFDGFEETENALKAFATVDKFSNEEVVTMLVPMKLEYSIEAIVSKNWNEEWEKNFEPVVVDDFVAVRADFHAPVKEVQYEIIITPKMSFGTGHHATTFLMMQQMREIDFKNKNVFDFGTGTGILAILAEKLGAAYIFAIDNDEWSIENARENAEKNNCSLIDISLEKEPGEKSNFDIILANINKNVILTYISLLVGRLNKNGQLLLSGLLKEDESDILQAIKALAVNHISTTHKNNWICVQIFN
ncbi:50S ribosomal protein L11 methyltransferase [Panacibacter ginsenosidivorans]|uniref:Ribosomal protein L11 methyltransferase n=1 Tax=Panacibacter ginsenosidivorans TaxID=1813871 RepID=A0A5B8VBV8_9BACT|nr:50S ribosomal protein L11 methyltransferase [Panacibacter ginsenosidivorans]QEC68493.1 50S ribosomal protein L11 methyltransferase [Panacibacter ginsenosidivorans]